MYKLNKRGLIELPACLHILIPFSSFPLMRPFREHSEFFQAVHGFYHIFGMKISLKITFSAQNLALKGTKSGAKILLFFEICNFFYIKNFSRTQKYLRNSKKNRTFARIFINKPK